LNIVFLGDNPDASNRYLLDSNRYLLDSNR